MKRIKNLDYFVTKYLSRLDAAQENQLKNSAYEDIHKKYAAIWMSCCYILRLK